MVRQKPDEIEEQLKKDELDSDGSEYPVSGTDDAADSEEMVKQVIGNEPEEDEENDEGFNLGTAVNKDEEAIFEKPIDDYEEEPESAIEKVEKKEDDNDDNAVSPNPYDQLGEDDDLDNDETPED